MSSIFQTSLNVSSASVNGLAMPSFADRSFYSAIMNSPRDSYPVPFVSFQWEDDLGDEIINESNEQIIFVQPAS